MLAAVAAAAGCGGHAREPSARDATAARLALMPLPRRDLPEARSLEVNADSSGPADDAIAAEMTVDPYDTPGQIARTGRLRGYSLSYVDMGLGRLARGEGVIEVDESVSVFRSAGTASSFADREQRDLRRFGGRQVAAGVMLVRSSRFGEPHVGDEAVATHAEFRLGSYPVYATYVDFRVGSLLAEVGLVRADRESADRRAVEFARALERRIRRVLAGKAHGRPQPLPPAAEPTPPRGVPDLSDHALQARDLASGSRIARDAYVSGSSLGSFRRDFHVAGGRVGQSRVLALESGVDVFPSPTHALEALLTIGTAYTGPDGPTLLGRLFATLDGGIALANGRVDSAGRLDVGDGTIAVQADFDSPLGEVTGVVIIVRVGDELGSIVTTGEGGAIDSTDLLPLAERVARRLGPGISE